MSVLGRLQLQEQLISSSDASSAQTTAASSTTTQAATTALPVPEPDIGGQTVKNYDGISMEGMVDKIVKINSGTAVIKTYTDKESFLHIFDTASGKITRTIKNQGTYYTLLGALKDGTIFTQKSGTNLLYRYEPNSDTPKEITISPAEVNVFGLDAENECIYGYNDKGELLKCSLSENTMTVVKKKGLYAMCMPYQGTDYVRANYLDDTNTKMFSAVYSMKTGERIVQLHKDSDKAYITKDLIADVVHPDDEGGNASELINIYSPKEKKRLTSNIYSHGFDESVTMIADKDSDKMLMAPYYTTVSQSSGSQNMKCIDVKTGKVAAIDQISTGSSSKAEACSVGTRGYWLIAMTDMAGEKKNTRLMLLDPERLNYNGELKKTDEVQSGYETIKCGADFEVVRKAAEKVEKKYGVRILVGDEIKNVCDSHVSSIETNKDVTPDRAAEIVEGIDGHLARYPKDFFDHFKEDGSGGLVICVVNEHDHSDGFLAAGEANKDDCRYVITVNLLSLDIDDHTLDHEIWHELEYMLADRGNGIDEEKWAALNPKGFEYVGDHNEYTQRDDKDTLAVVESSGSGKYDVPYFPRPYSFVSGMEDRATVAETVLEWVF